jgi:hypothetical protein
MEPTARCWHEILVLLHGQSNKRLGFKQMIYNPPSSYAGIPHPAENTQFPVMAADAVLTTEHAY